MTPAEILGLDLIRKKDRPQRNEEIFQAEQKLWVENGYMHDEHFQVMFTCMCFAAENLIKAKLHKGKGYIHDVEETALDVVLLICERDLFGRHITINKLSSYLYLPMIGIIYSAKRKRIDAEVSYNVILDVIKRMELAEENENSAIWDTNFFSTIDLTKIYE